MATRPYTVIMVSYGNTLSCQGNYSYEPARACKEIEAANPGWRVVALVPGFHASGMHTFGRSRTASEQQQVDVWDIPAGAPPAGKAPNCS